MKKFTSIKTLIFAVCILAAGAIDAQKFGHLNYGNLLLELPEVTAANKQLENFQKPLMAEVEAKYTTFQTNYQNLVKAAEGGGLAPIDQKKQEETLGKEQQDIATFEQDVQKRLMAKREELLKPILLRIEAAVTAVGKEGGYSGIFDTSNGQLLFVEDSDDVMTLVKAKL